VCLQRVREPQFENRCHDLSPGTATDEINCTAMLQAKLDHAHGLEQVEINAAGTLVQNRTSISAGHYVNTVT
jgi:hypothetical protein